MLSPHQSHIMNDVEAFCVVVGNQQERFKTVRTDEVKVPIDYAIAAGRQAIAKAILPPSMETYSNSCTYPMASK
jgi:fatty acid synthase subunit alpha